MKNQLVLFILISFSIVTSVFASASDVAVGKDTSYTVKDTVYFTYFAGLNHVNNLVFFGRSGAERTPYVSTDFYMQIPAGLWTNISLLSFYGNHSLTQIDNIGITLGYDKKLSKKVGISTSLNRFFYPSSNISIQTAATNLADFYLGYKSTYFKSSVGCSYMVGSVNDFFSSLNISGYFEKNYLFNSGFSILFEPRLAINAGTQNFVSVYQEEKNIIPATGFPTQIGGGRPSKNTTTTTTSTSDDNSINKSDFHILSYEFGVPVTLSYSRISLEAAYSFIIPVNLLEGDTSTKRSVFSVSLYYTLYKQKIRSK